ncbi:ribosomal protein S18-alanine N-acetyltransferase [Desulfosporosinus sp.]|uniref:ribosomal protein S18-alanine N-acetyltransferase n=1 Tax=Desulfosporosinus sp. TaxID=157907 RepID=UPI000E8843A2|nr:ribosomal protein S18-alanine N-acetyltransferase [Desulfosporosinus sp.]MBC2721465.1 ribosomal protein S18-alanine N-acetyltransferase [Desulfosporosinus sp.]MBC2727520.1 ribosomal protein S18-alanine N-acetyltransferase [Desulfosporosinus sp.]HBV87750.1 ribosomal-protein-alanine N-acetyltransferase [Desulfosporosinus sp.]
MNDGIVRPMCMDDLEAILKIEIASFSTPWSLQAFQAELKDNEYARYVCLEVEGKVIGYMGLWFILDEGHITNVAIAPNYRGQHWGEFLMRSVMSKMKDEGMERMTLEVRASNRPAQSLYNRLGFFTAGIRKGYYADTGEDALIMWAELGTEVNKS